MAEYKIEVYSKNGKCLGDIRHLAQGLKWTEQRNAAETVSFRMDLARYEEYVKKTGMRPYDFMDAGTTDIRVVRNGKDRVGAHLIKTVFSPNDPSVDIELSFTGYLNYFKDAYVDADYDKTGQGDIAWGVINQYQGKQDGDFGIRRGRFTSLGKNPRQRHQKRANVKDFLVRLSNVIDGPDFQFTPDKKFNTFDAMGSYRPDIRLSYPGNVASFGFERSVDSLANYVIGIGSGNGDDAPSTYATDPYSRKALYRREKIVTFSSVVRETTLQENTNGVLELLKDVRELPSFTLSDGVLDLNDVGLGDTIYIEMNGYIMFEHIRGFYRIEKIEVDVDENDAEEVTLTFDNLSVDDIIAQQEEDE
nr:MAG TPA: ReqiPepy6 protein [Caudoviricetes sp.]